LENLSSRDQLRQFSKFIVSHELYSHAVSTLDAAINATDASEQPMSAILTGEQGTGKTTVCKYMVAKLPKPHVKSEDDGVRKIIPAFYCSVPSPVTIKSLAIVMLDKLGDTDLSGSQGVLSKRLHELLKTCQTKVIYLDEFHHLLTSEAQKASKGVCDWVKGLMNATGVTVVLVGLPKCEDIINADSELSRRFPFRAHLDRIAYSTGSHSQYLMILRALTKAMIDHAGVEEVPPLTDVERASQIYVATGGNMNAIRQLLFLVLCITLERGKKVVEWSCFAESYERIYLESSMVRGRNPFKLFAAEVQKILANGGNR
jgi:type II secretory pathway predicted ATPase ExeA